MLSEIKTLYSDDYKHHQSLWQVFVYILFEIFLRLTFFFNFKFINLYNLTFHFQACRVLTESNQIHINHTFFPSSAKQGANVCSHTKPKLSNSSANAFGIFCFSFETAASWSAVTISGFCKITLNLRNSSIFVLIRSLIPSPSTNLQTYELFTHTTHDIT